MQSIGNRLHPLEISSGMIRLLRLDYLVEGVLQC
jgi:hypothetical protein